MSCVRSWYWKAWSTPSSFRQKRLSRRRHHEASHLRAAAEQSAAHRNSMRRSLMKDVIQHERIQTTEAKARAVRGEIERIITIAKRGRVTGDAVRLVHARRLVISRLGDQALAKKVFDDIAPRYVNRAGGYTRMLKLEARRGDAAKQVLLELVEE